MYGMSTTKHRRRHSTDGRRAIVWTEGALLNVDHWVPKLVYFFDCWGRVEGLISLSGFVADHAGCWRRGLCRSATVQCPCRASGAARHCEPVTIANT